MGHHSSKAALRPIGYFFAFCFLVLAVVTIQSKLVEASIPNLPEVIKKSKPSIVGIGIIQDAKLMPEDQFPTPINMTSSEGKPAFLYLLGSGFFVSKLGHVVTNAHVVQQFPTVSLLKASGAIEPAVVLRKNDVQDIAILKAQNETQAYLEFGDFNAVEEGEDVIFIGHPFGELGVVSHKGMVSLKASDGLQLNALVNSGNSGGPVIDVQSGKVVGVVRAKYGRLTDYLKAIKDGTIRTDGIGLGQIDFGRFTREVVNTVDKHIQLGIGYALSSEFPKEELAKSLGSSVPAVTSAVRP